MYKVKQPTPSVLPRPSHPYFSGYRGGFPRIALAYGGAQSRLRNQTLTVCTRGCCRTRSSQPLQGHDNQEALKQDYPVLGHQIHNSSSLSPRRDSPKPPIDFSRSDDRFPRHIVLAFAFAFAFAPTRFVISRKAILL